MDSFEIKIEGKPGDAESLLTGLFRSENKAYELLKNAIEREFRPNGAPEVTRMIVDRIKYNTATSKGSFRVLLDISYTFGCEDLVTKKDNETSEWTFNIDAGKSVLTCYSSPYADSRSTADEF